MGTCTLLQLGRAIADDDGEPDADCDDQELENELFGGYALPSQPSAPGRIQSFLAMICR